MALLDLNSMDPVLKTLYVHSKVNDLSYRKRPALGMLPKREDFRGRNMAIPIQYGHPQGRSATFSIAQSNQTGAFFKDFLVTRRKDYALATVDGETAEATETDAGAFVSALSAQIDGAFKSVSDSIETSIFRNGTGSIAQVGSVSTNALTLLYPTDVVNFEPGMTLQANPTDGGTPRTGTEIVFRVDRSNGILYSTNPTWTTSISALAANDYLLVQGDVNAKITGFDGWIPWVAPVPGDNWYGVDRSTDTRLSGQRYDASLGDTMEEALINAQSLGAREGAECDICFVNNVRFRDLVKGAQTKTNYERIIGQATNKDGALATIGYRGIIVDGDYGPIQVFPAPKCPVNTGWMLQKDTWGLASIGQAPKILMKDGLRIQRQATNDGYETRVGMYGNVWNDGPGWNTRIKFA